MRNITYAFIKFLMISGCTDKTVPDLKLWYNNPAWRRVEALPFGNGRLAAMVYGKVDNEVIKLNKSSLWSGGPVNPNPNPEAYQYLSIIRDAINKGEFDKATQLCKKMQEYAGSQPQMGLASLFENSIQFENGYLIVPTIPGLGLIVNEKEMEKQKLN